MCGYIGGVSVYLPILPYYYNVFLRVPFSKSVRVRGWGCLCRVVGFAFNGWPVCVGEACRRGFRVLFRLADRGHQFAVLRVVGWCAFYVYRMWFAFG